jgi:hypothetical protein
VQLLRASAKHTGETFDLSVVMTGTGDGGIGRGQELMTFAEAALGDDACNLAEARRSLLAALGPAALVDAAAVAGLFNAIDRVADATGTPLEDWKAEASSDFRSAIGIDDFMSRKEAIDRTS